MAEEKFVAAIGCGYWGKNPVCNLHAPGVLGAMCDTIERADL